MSQEFVIGRLKLIEAEDGSYAVAQQAEEGSEIIASFKFPLDALEYFTKYSIVLAELEAHEQKQTIITNVIPDDKEEQNG
jgi:hypothetical protein